MDCVAGLACTICGTRYGVDEVEYVCPEHGDDGILDVLFDYDAVGARLTRQGLVDSELDSIWRYLPT